MKKLLKNKKGFTLVELMVVVAIMGILVAVAVPMYNNVTEKAAKQTCETNARTLESAIMMMKAVDLNETVTTGAITALSSYKIGDQELSKYVKTLPVCKVKITGDAAVYSVDANGNVTCSNPVCTYNKITPSTSPAA